MRVCIYMRGVRKANEFLLKKYSIATVSVFFVAIIRKYSELQKRLRGGMRKHG